MIITKKKILIWLVAATALTFFSQSARVVAASSLSPADVFAANVNIIPRVTKILDSMVTNGVRVTHLRYESLEGSSEGTTNRCEIFAVVARPVGDGTNILPGILICHGGKQDVPEEKAIGWAQLGFVALAPELPGYMGTNNIHSVTRVKGQHSFNQLFQAEPNCFASSMFDTVMAGLLGFNLLSCQTGVDTNKLCITGISWGGYMTTMLSGLLGERVKAAFSLYGCGFYLNDAAPKTDLMKLPEAQRHEWMQNFDAGTKIGNVRAAFFLCPAANDFFFRPASFLATYEALHDPKFICIGPNKSHWIDLPGGTTSWNGPTYTEMEAIFFHTVLDGRTKELPRLSVVDPPGTFIVRGLPANCQLWAYYSSNANIDTKKRVWTRTTVTMLSPNTFRADVPESLVDYDWYGGITFNWSVNELSRPMSLTTVIRRVKK